ncbi:MAG: S8 family serine peptidase, partial [Bacteroidota bacterium]
MKNIILSIVVLCTIGAAQQLIVKTNGEIKKIASNTSGISVSSVDNNIITSESQNDNIRLIVELKAPSRAEQKINGRVFSKTTADMTKQQLVLADAETKVNREFENIFSGFAVTTKRQNIQAIASLPGVKSVYPDAVVNAVPYSVGSASQDIPKNPASAATGKQVRIGIIDTGIDYNHEAFGKGFGSGFAVTGGYDFVNNDPDPMDDNGHGTHVAGIIGGNSATITGAAKDAILFAYKVLDQSGSGSSSSVIAAIEQAMRDSIQVLNLSLGTPSGSADDPLTSAVNRAVQSGMIVVVAAGNTGEYSTINSPGTAEFALTVGATDANAIASFSSKGPETENYRIKPDIVAPGVNILSAKKGGGYVQMSGTSMATPYVTAIAAGMRELHPEWSAIQIRDAIVSNSTDIGNSLFSQGHGKVSERVLLSSVFSSPAQLSFGFNPPAEASWKQLRSVTLYNKSSEPRTYRLISSSTNPALQFRFVPQQVEIVPQGSAEIAVELETNNLFLSNNSAFENGYSGKLLAVGTS